MFTKGKVFLRISAVLLIIFMLAFSVGCAEDVQKIADILKDAISASDTVQEESSTSEGKETVSESTAPSKNNNSKIYGSNYGSGSHSTTNPTSSKPSGGTSAPAVKKKLTFATWINHKKGEGAAPIASFEQKYGATVNILYLSQNNYVSELTAHNASGQAPDVFVDNNEFPALLPVAKDLKTVKTLNLSEAFWDSYVISSSTVGGKTYLVNSDNSPWSYRFMCFYNKSIFANAGIKSPGDYYAENNWTVETFKQCAAEAADVGYIGASVRPEFAAGIWETAATELQNGKFVNTIAGSDLSSAYKWMLQGRERGIFSLENELNSFKAGYCAMFLYGDFGLRTTGGLNTMNVNDIGFVPLPKVNKTDSYYPAAGTWRAYGICKNSKNADLAGSFLRHFLEFKNYNRSSMFLNSEASSFFDTLRQKSTCTYMYNATSIGNNQIKSVSSSNVDAVLRSLKNEVDARIIKDNACIK